MASLPTSYSYSADLNNGDKANYINTNFLGKYLNNISALQKEGFYLVADEDVNIIVNKANNSYDNYARLMAVNTWSLNASYGKAFEGLNPNDAINTKMLEISKNILDTAKTNLNLSFNENPATGNLTLSFGKDSTSVNIECDISVTGGRLIADNSEYEKLNDLGLSNISLNKDQFIVINGNSLQVSNISVNITSPHKVYTDIIAVDSNSDGIKDAFTLPDGKVITNISKSSVNKDQVLFSNNIEIKVENNSKLIITQDGASHEENISIWEYLGISEDIYNKMKMAYQAATKDGVITNSLNDMGLKLLLSDNAVTTGSTIRTYSYDVNGCKNGVESYSYSKTLNIDPLHNYLISYTVSELTLGLIEGKEVVYRNVEKTITFNYGKNKTTNAWERKYFTETASENLNFYDSTGKLIDKKGTSTSTTKRIFTITLPASVNSPEAEEGSGFAWNIESSDADKKVWNSNWVVVSQTKVTYIYDELYEGSGIFYKKAEVTDSGVSYDYKFDKDTGAIDRNASGTTYTNKTLVYAYDQNTGLLIDSYLGLYDSSAKKGEVKILPEWAGGDNLKTLTFDEDCFAKINYSVSNTYSGIHSANYEKSLIQSNKNGTQFAEKWEGQWEARSYSAESYVIYKGQALISWSGNQSLSFNDTKISDAAAVYLSDSTRVSELYTKLEDSFLNVQFNSSTSKWTVTKSDGTLYEVNGYDLSVAGDYVITEENIRIQVSIYGDQVEINARDISKGDYFKYYTDLLSKGFYRNNENTKVYISSLKTNNGDINFNIGDDFDLEKFNNFKASFTALEFRDLLNGSPLRRVSDVSGSITGITEMLGVLKDENGNFTFNDSNGNKVYFAEKVSDASYKIYSYNSTGEMNLINTVLLSDINYLTNTYTLSLGNDDTLSISKTGETSDSLMMKVDRTVDKADLNISLKDVIEQLSTADLLRAWNSKNGNNVEFDFNKDSKLYKVNTNIQNFNILKYNIADFSWINADPSNYEGVNYTDSSENFTEFLEDISFNIDFNQVTINQNTLSLSVVSTEYKRDQEGRLLSSNSNVPKSFTYDVGDSNSNILRSQIFKEKFTIKQTEPETSIQGSYSPLGVLYTDSFEQKLSLEGFGSNLIESKSRTIDGFTDTRIINGKDVDIGGAVVSETLDRKMTILQNQSGSWGAHCSVNTVFSGVWHENKYDNTGEFTEGSSFNLSEIFKGQISYDDFTKTNAKLINDKNSWGGFSSPLKDKSNRQLNVGTYINLVKWLSKQDSDKHSLEYNILNSTMENLLEKGEFIVNSRSYMIETPESDNLLSRTISIDTLNEIAGERTKTATTDLSFSYSSEKLLYNSSKSSTEGYTRKTTAVGLNRTMYEYSASGSQIDQFTRGWNVGLRLQEQTDLWNPVTDSLLNQSGLGLKMLGLSIAKTTTEYIKQSGEWKESKKTEYNYIYGNNDSKEHADKTITVTKNVTTNEYDSIHGQRIKVMGNSETWIYDTDIAKCQINGAFPVGFVDALGNPVVDSNNNVVQKIDNKDAVILSYGKSDLDYILVRGVSEVKGETSTTYNIQSVLSNNINGVRTLSQDSDRVSFEKSTESNYFNINAQVSSQNKMSISRNTIKINNHEIPENAAIPTANENYKLYIELNSSDYLNKLIENINYLLSENISQTTKEFKWNPVKKSSDLQTIISYSDSIENNWLDNYVCFEGTDTTHTRYETDESVIKMHSATLYLYDDRNALYGSITNSYSITTALQYLSESLPNQAVAGGVTYNLDSDKRARVVQTITNSHSEQCMIFGELKTLSSFTNSINYSYSDNYSDSSKGYKEKTEVSASFSAVLVSYAYDDKSSGTGELLADKSKKNGVTYKFNSNNGNIIPKTLTIAFNNAKAYGNFYLESFSYDKYELVVKKGELLDSKKTSYTTKLPNTYTYTEQETENPEWANGYNNYLNSSLRANYVNTNYSKEGFYLIADETVEFSVSETSNTYDSYGRLKDVSEREASISFKDLDMNGKFSTIDISDARVAQIMRTENLVTASLQNNPIEYLQQIISNVANAIWKTAGESILVRKPVEFGFSNIVNTFDIVKEKTVTVKTETWSRNLDNSGGYTTDDLSNNAVIDYSVILANANYYNTEYDYDSNGRLIHGDSYSISGTFEYDRALNEVSFERFQLDLDLEKINGKCNYDNRLISLAKLDDGTDLTNFTDEAIKGSIKTQQKYRDITLNYTLNKMVVFRGMAKTICEKSWTAGLKPSEDNSPQSFTQTDYTYSSTGRLIGALNVSKTRTLKEDGKFDVSVSRQNYVIINGQKKVIKSTSYGDNIEITTYTYDNNARLLTATSDGTTFKIINGQALWIEKTGSGIDYSTNTSNGTYWDIDSVTGNLVEYDSTRTTYITSNWSSLSTRTFDFMGRQKSQYSESDYDSSNSNTTSSEKAGGVISASETTIRYMDGAIERYLVFSSATSKQDAQNYAVNNHLTGYTIESSTSFDTYSFANGIRISGINGDFSTLESGTSSSTPLTILVGGKGTLTKSQLISINSDGSFIIDGTINNTKIWDYLGVNKEKLINAATTLKYISGSEITLPEKSAIGENLIPQDEDIPSFEINNGEFILTNLKTDVIDAAELDVNKVKQLKFFKEGSEDSLIINIDSRGNIESINGEVQSGDEKIWDYLGIGHVKYNNLVNRFLTINEELKNKDAQNDLFNETNTATGGSTNYTKMDKGKALKGREDKTNDSVTVARTYDVEEGEWNTSVSKRTGSDDNYSIVNEVKGFVKNPKTNLKEEITTSQNVTYVWNEKINDTTTIVHSQTVAYDYGFKEDGTVYCISTSFNIKDIKEIKDADGNIVSKELIKRDKVRYDGKYAPIRSDEPAVASVQLTYEELKGIDTPGEFTSLIQRAEIAYMSNLNYAPNGSLEDESKFVSGFKTQFGSFGITGKPDTYSVVFSQIFEKTVIKDGKEVKEKTIEILSENDQSVKLDEATTIISLDISFGDLKFKDLTNEQKVDFLNQLSNLISGSEKTGIITMTLCNGMGINEKLITFDAANLKIAFETLGGVKTITSFNELRTFCNNLAGSNRGKIFLNIISGGDYKVTGFKLSDSTTTLNSSTMDDLTILDIEKQIKAAISEHKDLSTLMIVVESKTYSISAMDISLTEGEQTYTTVLDISGMTAEEKAFYAPLIANEPIVLKTNIVNGGALYSTTTNMATSNFYDLNGELLFSYMNSNIYKTKANVTTQVSVPGHYYTFSLARKGNAIPVYSQMWTYNSDERVDFILKDAAIILDKNPQTSFTFNERISRINKDGIVYDVNDTAFSVTVDNERYGMENFNPKTGVWTTTDGVDPFVRIFNDCFTKGITNGTKVIALKDLTVNQADNLSKYGQITVDGSVYYLDYSAASHGILAVNYKGTHKSFSQGEYQDNIENEYSISYDERIEFKARNIDISTKVNAFNTASNSQKNTKMQDLINYLKTNNLVFVNKNGKVVDLTKITSLELTEIISKDLVYYKNAGARINTEILATFSFKTTTRDDTGVNIYSRAITTTQVDAENKIYFARKTGFDYFNNASAGVSRVNAGDNIVVSVTETNTKMIEIGGKDKVQQVVTQSRNFGTTGNQKITRSSDLFAGQENVPSAADSTQVYIANNSFSERTETVNYEYNGRGDMINAEGFSDTYQFSENYGKDYVKVGDNWEKYDVNIHGGANVTGRATVNGYVFGTKCDFVLTGEKEFYAIGEVMKQNYSHAIDTYLIVGEDAKKLSSDTKTIYQHDTLYSSRPKIYFKGSDGIIKRDFKLTDAEKVSLISNGEFTRGGMAYSFYVEIEGLGLIKLNKRESGNLSSITVNKSGAIQNYILDDEKVQMLILGNAIRIGEDQNEIVFTPMYEQIVISENSFQVASEKMSYVYGIDGKAIDQRYEKVIDTYHNMSDEEIQRNRGTDADQFKVTVTLADGSTKESWVNAVIDSNNDGNPEKISLNDGSYIERCILNNLVLPSGDSIVDMKDTDNNGEIDWIKLQSGEIVNESIKTEFILGTSGYYISNFIDLGEDGTIDQVEITNLSDASSIIIENEPNDEYRIGNRDFIVENIIDSNNDGEADIVVTNARTFEKQNPAYMWDALGSTQTGFMSILEKAIISGALPKATEDVANWNEVLSIVKSDIVTKVLSPSLDAAYVNIINSLQSIPNAASLSATNKQQILDLMVAVGDLLTDANKYNNIIQTYAITFFGQDFIEEEVGQTDGGPQTIRYWQPNFGRYTGEGVKRFEEFYNDGGFYHNPPGFLNMGGGWFFGENVTAAEKSYVINGMLLDILKPLINRLSLVTTGNNSNGNNIQISLNNGIVQQVVLTNGDLTRTFDANYYEIVDPIWEQIIKATPSEFLGDFDEAKFNKMFDSIKKGVPVYTTIAAQLRTYDSTFIESDLIGCWTKFKSDGSVSTRFNDEILEVELGITLSQFTDIVSTFKTNGNSAYKSWGATLGITEDKFNEICSASKLDAASIRVNIENLTKDIGNYDFVRNNVVRISSSYETQDFAMIDGKMLLKKDKIVTEYPVDLSTEYKDSGIWKVEQKKTLSIQTTNYAYDNNGDL
ncbi:MAG: hypothetical protein ACD_79C00687G0001, partial [uncultured bacterium]